MRTVVNLSNYLVILGRGGIAGLEFVNGESTYKYNLICSRDYSVLVKISLKTLRDYFKRDLNKHIKPLYLDQEKIAEDFLNKYQQFKQCMKVTFKSNQNSYLKKSEEERLRARDLFAERSLHNLRFKNFNGKSMDFSQTKNQFNKMNILINNVDDLKSGMAEQTLEHKLAIASPQRRLSRISRFPTLKPFIRNYRRNSSVMVVQHTTEPTGIQTEEKEEKIPNSLYVTLAQYNKHIPSNSEQINNKVRFKSREQMSSLFTAEIDKLCPHNNNNNVFSHFI
jgi:hypothetical protein